AVSSFDELELSRPADSAVRFDAPARPAPSAPRPAADVRIADAGPVLELEGGPPQPLPRPVAQRLSKQREAPQKQPVAGRRRRLAPIVLLVLLLLAGGGFVLYRRHVAAVERQAAISDQLSVARSAYAASDPKHWQRAAAAAR